MRHRRALLAALLAHAVGVVLFAQTAPQQPPPGRGRGAAQAPAPGVVQVSGHPPVDAAKADAGKAVWVAECITCHGSQARGTDTGPNIIRSDVVNFDRSSPDPGSVLGPFLQKGHPTQSGRPSASIAPDDVVALAQFLRQRVNDTMRGSPVFVPGDVLTGNRTAGETLFNGEFRCATCHTASSHSLNGVATRIPNPVDLQQRMLFPSSGAGRGGPDPNPVMVTIMNANGQTTSGPLVAQDDFFVTYRDADGGVHVVRRVPGMKVTTDNPLQAHIDLLDRLTDTNIHDLVAYLETLK